MLETPKAVTTDRDKIRHLVFFGKRFTDASYLDKMVNQQERLEAALAYVIGTIIGDGFITRVTKWRLPKLMLQAKDADFVARFKHECGLIAPGSLATKIYPVKVEDSMTFVFGFVQRNLGEYIVRETENRTKIPPWIFSKLHAFRAFLEAIIDGEGHIRLGGACHISNTEAWIVDIQEHIAMLGVGSSLSKYKQNRSDWKDYWVLRIPAIEIQKLEAKLGIERKAVRLLKSSETICCAPAAQGEDRVLSSVQS